MAMLRRPRPPGGGRHPPPLAPTVSSFKPRAQWTNSGSSIFLYVNLPGFYMDQIEIKKDERTRTVQIQGQRPLSTHTKARFNETYRVPESCDMTKSNNSFSHGLLTIEFPVAVESEKQGETLQRPNQEESRRSGLSRGSSFRRKKSLDKEKQVGTSQEKAVQMENKEEPRTYKSVVEGKREVTSGGREISEQKMKEGEASLSLGSKEHVKEEKVAERKEAAQVGQHKIVQKLQEEARSTPTVGGSVKPKVLANEEKVAEKKKDTDIGQNKTGQKVKEEGITRTPSIGGSLEPRVQFKAEQVVERNSDGERKKLIEEGKINLGQKKQEKNAKPIAGDETRSTEKKTDAKKKSASISIKEAGDVNGNVKSKQDEKNEKMVRDSVKEGDVQEIVKQKKINETEDVKDNAEMKEPKKVDSDDYTKEESTQGGEDRKKTLESETSPLLKEGQNKTDMDKEESQKSDLSLVNVGAAALVIMVFGAYVCVPVLKLFI